MKIINDTAEEIQFFVTASGVETIDPDKSPADPNIKASGLVAPNAAREFNPSGAGDNALIWMRPSAGNFPNSALLFRRRVATEAAEAHIIITGD